jgi:hypothetical protein
MTSRDAGDDGQRPRQPPRLLFTVLNPVVRLVLRSPLNRVVSDRLMLLTVTGRTSGKSYTIPIGYARDGDTLYSGTGAGWARNLRGGAPVRVILQGERRRGRAELVSDVDGLMTAYRTIYKASPAYANALSRSTGVSFLATGEVFREDVARARDAGHVVIRTTLEPET